MDQSKASSGLWASSRSKTYAMFTHEEQRETCTKDAYMWIFNGLKISHFLGMYGNTCQVCFSDCNQQINNGEVYMVVKQSRIMHIKLKAN